MNWADKCFGKALYWLKLSNSGDALKLMIPSYSRKAISGQNNYLGMVTSHKMNESEMGYRGSKSVLKSNAVKEQRVDGSWNVLAKSKSNTFLRCTLMGFERNYPFKIPTNQLINRTFSTGQPSINPWFITGFADAESSFFVSIYRDDKSKLKWRVTPSFSIHIHIKDIALLNMFQQTLGVGKERKNSAKTVLFRVDNIREMQVIVDHFSKYPLVGAKYSDFLLFKQCFELIKNKKHLSQAGLEQIVSLRCNLNKGLSNELNEAFPNIVPVDRPKYVFKGIPHPLWISGFISGDSTFCVSIEKSSNKIGKRVRLIFGTCLHIRDKAMLIGIANYFKPLESEVLNETKSRAAADDVHQYIYDHNQSTLLQIKSYSDIANIIIPFFDKYPVLGIKSLDFSDFKEVAHLIENREHLAEQGFTKIKSLVDRMNLSRDWENYIEDKTNN